MPFVTVPDAIEEIRAGRIVVVVDDEDRENEGDLTVAAEKVTPEIINFMAVQGRGLICLALTPERCDYLRLPLMSPNNTSMFGTAFCESIDAREGGVLVRAGQTEASVDLARLAGLTPAGVICEIMNDDGTMARAPQLVEFCKRHNLKMLSVADLIRHRMKHERFVRRVAEGAIPTEFGEFRTVAYASDLNPEYHLALVKGDVSGKENVLVRMLSRCVFGDVFGSTQCECSQLVRNALGAIAEAGQGVLVYLHETGPGFRIDRDGAGSPTMLGHGRDFMHYQGEAGRMQLQHEHGIGAQILSDLGLHTIRLLTNHPRKIVALEGFGIEVVDQIPVGH